MSISHRLAVIATQNVFSYLLSLGPNYGKSKVTGIEWPQNDIEWYKTKGTPYMLNNYPWVPNFIPFCTKIALFPDNCFFFFFLLLHRLHGKFEICEKKIVKNPKTKISKILNIFCEEHLEENSGQVWKLLSVNCRRSGVLKFSLPQDPMLMKINKIRYNFIFQIQKSQT